MKKYFDLKVGFTCNNYCIHCVITDKKGTKDLTTQEIKNIIDGVNKDYMIGFTGGEASIRKDWIEILKYAKETGHETALQTNGTAFYDADLTNETAKYLDMVLIAIHSHDPDIHNKIVDCPPSANMFEKTRDGLINLVKTGINVQTQTVISKLNIRSLPRTYDWIQELVPGIRMNFTFPHPNGNAFNNRDLVVPKYSDIHNEIKAILSKWGHLIQTEAIPMCYLYPYHDIVENIDEEITSKSSVSRTGIDPGNKDNKFFDKDGITENYKEANLSEKRKARECAFCLFNNRCPGVWKEYAELYKDELDLQPLFDPSQKRGAIIIDGKEKCDNTCIFCPGTNPICSDESKFKTFIEEAQYFIDNRIGALEISGGDPGEYKYIAEAILYLRDSGIPFIQLATHGRMFSDENFTKKIALSGLYQTRIPLYGINKQMHNRTADYHNIDGQSFDETIEGIRNVSKYNIRVFGHTVINEYNKNDLFNIVKLYKELTNNNFNMMVVGVPFLSDTMSENTENWFIPMKDVGKYIKPFLEEISEEKDVNIEIHDIPYCTIGRYDDRLKFTTAPDLGCHIIEEENRSEEDNQVPHYRVKTYFEECKECSLQDKCGGITVNELNKFGYGNLKAIK